MLFSIALSLLLSLLFLPTSSSITCPDPSVLNPATSYQTCITPSDFQRTTHDIAYYTQIITTSLTLFTSFLTFGNALSISAGITSRIFSIIKYLNISFSQDLQISLVSWTSNFISLGFTIDVPDKILAQLAFQSTPTTFTYYNTPSSFLINFWSSLLILCPFIILFGLVKFTEWLMFKINKSNTGTSLLLIKKSREALQNFVITLLYIVSGDIILYGILELRSNIDFKIGLTLVSFMAILIGFKLVIGNFYLHASLTWEYQKLKTKLLPGGLNEFLEKYKGNIVLFQDVKDQNKPQQLFLLFLVLRDVLFSVVLVTLFEHTAVQLILMLMINMSMVTYLILYRPLKNPFDEALQFFYEAIYLTINILMLAMNTMDDLEAGATEIRSVFGKIIIILNLLFFFITSIFMLYKTTITGLLKSPNKNLSKIHADSSPSLNPNTTDDDLHQDSKAKRKIKRSIFLPLENMTYEELEQLHLNNQAKNQVFPADYEGFSSEPRRLIDYEGGIMKPEGNISTRGGSPAASYGSGRSIRKARKSSYQDYEMFIEENKSPWKEKKAMNSMGGVVRRFSEGSININQFNEIKDLNPVPVSEQDSVVNDMDLMFQDVRVGAAEKSQKSSAPQSPHSFQATDL